MQKWEYLTKTAHRTIRAKDWEWNSWQDAVDTNKLGEEGWELVCAYPVSSMVRDQFAGLTTEVVYIFKRAIQDGA
jgi:hypothetical protein